MMGRRVSDFGLRCGNELDCRLRPFSLFSLFEILCFAVVVFTPIGGNSQLIKRTSSENGLSFEVATINPNGSGSSRDRIWSSGDEYHLQNLSLRQIIKAAYRAASDDQLIGGPDQLLSRRFDINAKLEDSDVRRFHVATEGAQERELNLMLQSLLDERFHLRLHFALRSMPALALLPAKGGAKLSPSALEQAKEAAGNQDPHPTEEAMSEPEKGASVTIRIQTRRAEVVAIDASIDSLTSLLASQPESDKHPIVNKTGLTGRYDWTLRWTPDTLRGSQAGDQNAEQPSLITALDEQLGLRLISEKDQVEAIAIDHLEIPSDN